jgi:uncharacterized protein DUF1996
MSARLLLFLAAAPVAAAVLVSTAVAGGDKGETTMRLGQLRGVNFVSSCRFSHRAADDPIVFPGQPGLSHDHSFVGNVSTSGASTLSSLLAAGTTCQRAGDTAAYWMPSLNVDGRAVMPLGATIYYRRKTLAHVNAFPPGFRMIAGDARATTAQPLRVAFWNCGVLAGVAPSSTPPACPDTRRRSLRLHVNFPSCWDGQSLDSSSHQSHVAYPVRGRCPVSHQKALPAISLIYRYPTTGGTHVSLASGGQLSAHADFFNAWQQSDLQRLVDGCLNALRHCARGE